MGSGALVNIIVSHTKSSEVAPSAIISFVRGSIALLWLASSFKTYASDLGAGLYSSCSIVVKSD